MLSFAAGLVIVAVCAFALYCKFKQWERECQREQRLHRRIEALERAYGVSAAPETEEEKR